MAGSALRGVCGRLRAVMQRRTPAQPKGSKRIRPELPEMNPP
jgi:hypothetical protein